VVVLRLAERPRLPHGVSLVDTAGSDNGAVEKIGATKQNLKQLGRHYAFNAVQRAARKLSRVEEEVSVALPGGPVREACGHPRRRDPNIGRVPSKRMCRTLCVAPSGGVHTYFLSARSPTKVFVSVEPLEMP
jgi:hypothetical protein